VTNPHPCEPSESGDATSAQSQLKDCYSLTMISVVSYKRPCTADADCPSGQPCVEDTDPDADPLSKVCSQSPRVRYWGKSFTVVVEHPKTTSAKLQKVSFSPDLADPGPAFHAAITNVPSVTADGRLLVAKLGRSPLDPNTGDLRLDPASIYPNTPEPLDIVYATYPASAPSSALPCDVTQWTTLHPISHAHTDANMLGRYGIAAHELRDPQGNPVPDGKDLQVTYPWIDRDGDNLFFTALQSTLFYKAVDDQGNNNGGIESRYTADCLPGVTPCSIPASLDGPGGVKDFEEARNFRGTGVAGLWTHGKMVLLDSAINNIDYGLSRGDDDQRLLDLYVTAAGAPVSIRAGTGKYPGGQSPFHSTGNTSFIDSLEHVFNWDENMMPFAVRDVVWILNTGKASAELVFDDYLDPNALIVAEMAGALERNGAKLGSLTYYDGFNQVGEGIVNTQSSREVRFQNAATSRQWQLPSHGITHGDVRLEPVALGGIEGKGVWLDGTDDAISFILPNQAPARVVSDHAWYLSAFIDPRFADDGQPRQLFKFGNGASIVLEGRSTVVYENAAGVVVEEIDIPGLLHPILTTDPLQMIPEVAAAPARGAWSHLAFVMDYPQNRTLLYVNGYLKWITAGVFPQQSSALTGPLYVGDAPGNGRSGFVGWVDEVKLLAYHPTPELACNHARGTLMRVSGGSAEWALLAQAYPTFAHDNVSDALGSGWGDKYVCYHKYRDHRRSNPRLVNLALGLTSIRERLNFPGQPLPSDPPLQFNKARPDSTGNDFCLTCHHSGAQPGLDITVALAAGGSTMLQHDKRRQPMMPPRRMFGNVPAGFFGTLLPPQDSMDVLIDEYFFPTSPP